MEAHKLLAYLVRILSLLTIPYVIVSIFLSAIFCDSLRCPVNYRPGHLNFSWEFLWVLLVPVIVIPLGFRLAKALLGGTNEKQTNASVATTTQMTSSNTPSRNESIWAFWVVFVVGISVIVWGVADFFLYTANGGDPEQGTKPLTWLIIFIIYLLVFFLAHKSLLRSRVKSQASLETGQIPQSPKL